MAKVHSDKKLHCPTCKKTSAVRSWRWNNYYCPRCGEHDACFATGDKLGSGTFNVVPGTYFPVKKSS